MSLLKKLFGGGGGSGGAASNAQSETYKGYTITPAPEKQSGGFRIGAIVEKEIDGEIRKHHVIRADTYGDAATATDASVFKAKQVIDEQGDRLFGWTTVDIFDHVLTDRGSKYAVAGQPVTTQGDIDAALKHLKKNKKFARATHNTWAVLLNGTPQKNDDGESGAGMVILRMLEREGLENHLVIVTRWYGGKPLGGDRFRHVQTSVRHYLDNRTR